MAKYFRNKTGASARALLKQPAPKRPTRDAPRAWGGGLSRGRSHRREIPVGAGEVLGGTAKAQKWRSAEIGGAQEAALRSVCVNTNATVRKKKVKSSTPRRARDGWDHDLSTVVATLERGAAFGAAAVARIPSRARRRRVEAQVRGVLRGARASHNRADTAVGGDGAKKRQRFRREAARYAR